MLGDGDINNIHLWGLSWGLSELIPLKSLSRFWNVSVLRCLYETHKYKTFGEGFIFGEMEEGIIIILKIKQGKNDFSVCVIEDNDYW